MCSKRILNFFQESSIVPENNSQKLRLKMIFVSYTKRLGVWKRISTCMSRTWTKTNASFHSSGIKRHNVNINIVAPSRLIYTTLNMHMHIEQTHCRELLWHCVNFHQGQVNHLTSFNNWSQFHFLSLSYSDTKNISDLLYSNTLCIKIKVIKYVKH